MKKLISITIGVILCAILAVLIHNQRLKAKVHEREATFISIYYLAAVAMDEYDYESRPKTIEELLAPRGSVLLRPFVDGISYTVSETGFSLAESVSRRTTMFESDRIVSNENAWPHWEDSGEYARRGDRHFPAKHLKYPEQ